VLTGVVKAKSKEEKYYRLKTKGRKKNIMYGGASSESEDSSDY